VLDWSEDEDAVVSAMNRFHIHSGHCAALARALKPLAMSRFGAARAIQLKPEEGALYLVPKDPTRLPHWRSHLYVETHLHAVDAVTGSKGHPAESYLGDFWDFPDFLVSREVDPDDIDPGLQQEDSL